MPLTEDKPLQPISVYGISKRDSEELALVLGEAYGFEAVALRYLNVYGPRQALANPYTGVAAIFASRLLGGDGPARLRGRSPDPRPRPRRRHRRRDPCGDGRTRRRPGRPSTSPPAGGSRSASSPPGSASCSPRGLEPEITGEFRAGDIRHCFADAARARELLGFEARTTLEDGLPELVEWVGRQTVTESGDAALEALRRAGLVG